MNTHGRKKRPAASRAGEKNHILWIKVSAEFSALVRACAVRRDGGDFQAYVANAVKAAVENDIDAMTHAMLREGGRR